MKADHTNTTTSMADEGPAKKKRKTAVKREWLPWEFCKFIEPEDSHSPPPFGWKKPSSVTDDERAIMHSQSDTLFPVGFYDMTPTKRGVTKGRGDWKGKEALRLAHCSAEKNGCRFKARFCRIANGMEIFTSGDHDVKAHLTPRKRGLAPAARAIVTKYREEPQSKLVEWLKDGGLIDGVSEDLEKVKQQIKRRKMTLKRKQKRNAESSSESASLQDGSSVHELSSEECSTQDESLPRAFDTVDEDDEGEEDDPLTFGKFNLLQDDSFINLIDPPPQDGRHETAYDSEEGEASLHEEAVHYAAVQANQLGLNGPYSPTTVVDEVSPPFGFDTVFENAPLLQAMDLFPRVTPDNSFSETMPSLKRGRAFASAPKPATLPGLDPDGAYSPTAV